MFFGGGGPTTEEIIQKEFEKQRKFIEEQFSKQQDFFKDLMTQTEVENVKAKALGVLDALQSRFEYISAYEDLESCLEEDSVVEITQKVEYFMDQSDAEAVKHTTLYWISNQVEFFQKSQVDTTLKFLVSFES